MSDDSILDFQKAYKKKKLDERIEEISVVIYKFCREYGHQPEDFLNKCSDLAEDDKLNGVVDPVSGEVLFGFFKIEDEVRFITANEFHDLKEKE